MVFFTITTVIFQPISTIEEKARQILFVDVFDSHFLNKKKQARGAVLNKTIYKNVFKFLTNILPEFLQSNHLANKVTQQLATNKFNLDLNIDFYD